MTLENQVVSLDLSRRLKELGFEQESLFYWARDIDTGDYALHEKHYLVQPFITDSISAYTVAELGEILPMLYMPVKDADHNNEWLWIESPENKSWVAKHWETTEADARAKMLIYLREQELI